MILHRYFWASILVGKVGPALQVQASEMSILAPSQSLPTLSVKSGPQDVTTTESSCQKLFNFHFGEGGEPNVASSLRCLEASVPLCDPLALEGVRDGQRGCS